MENREKYRQNYKNQFMKCHRNMYNNNDEQIFRRLMGMQDKKLGKPPLTFESTARGPEKRRKVRGALQRKWEER